MQMLHHADVARAVILSLDQPQAGGQIYNVADDLPIAISKIREMNGFAGTNLEADGEVEDPWEGIVSTTKIKAELGFHPIYPSIHDAERMKAL